MNDFLEEGALEEHVLRYKSREGVPGGGGEALQRACSSGQMLTRPGAAGSRDPGSGASASAGLTV